MREQEHNLPSPDASAQTLMRWALRTYHPYVAIASSFSLEDGVLIDMAMRLNSGARVFAIDTGRLDPETYEAAEAFRTRYDLSIEWVFPRHESVEDLERRKGLFSFRESLTNRHECCGIRKVEPLRRALADLKAWMTGLRRDQSVTRAALNTVEKDVSHGGIVKVNPLAAWTLDDIQAYVKQHAVPVNRLYQRGYASIGCAPCTRAIAPGEHPRAGRWWWEQPEHKECGLHIER